MGHATPLRKKQIEYVSQADPLNQECVNEYGVNGWV